MAMRFYEATAAQLAAATPAAQTFVMTTDTSPRRLYIGDGSTVGGILIGPSSGGVTDGDKGDVTVASGVWTVDNGTISNAKLATVASQIIKGRSTGGAGAPEDLTSSQARAIVEYGAPSVVTISGATTLTQAAHQGRVLYCTAAVSLTVNNSTDFDALASCEIVAYGGIVTIVATATVRRVGSKPLTIPQYGRAVLSRTNTVDEYLLTGEMA